MKRRPPWRNGVILWLCASSVIGANADITIFHPESLSSVVPYSKVVPYYSTFGVQESEPLNVTIRILENTDRERICTAYSTDSLQDLRSEFNNTLILESTVLPCHSSFDTSITLKVYCGIGAYAAWIDLEGVIPGYAVNQNDGDQFQSVQEVCPDHREKSGYFHIAKSENSSALITFLQNGGTAIARIHLDQNPWSLMFASLLYRSIIRICLPVFGIAGFSSTALFLTERIKTNRERKTSIWTVPVIVLLIELPSFAILSTLAIIDGFGSTGWVSAAVTRGSFQFFQGSAFGVLGLMLYLMSKILDSVFPVPAKSLLEFVTKRSSFWKYLAVSCFLFDLSVTFGMSYILGDNPAFFIAFAIVSVFVQVVVTLAFGYHFFHATKAFKRLMQETSASYATVGNHRVVKAMENILFRTETFFKFYVLVQCFAIVGAIMCATIHIFRPSGFFFTFGELLAVRLTKSWMNILWNAPMESKFFKFGYLRKLRIGAALSTRSHASVFPAETTFQRFGSTLTRGSVIFSEKKKTVQSSASAFRGEQSYVNHEIKSAHH